MCVGITACNTEGVLNGVYCKGCNCIVGGVLQGVYCKGCIAGGVLHGVYK